MKADSRKIAYAGAATALASVCSIITLYLPLKVTPLLVASLCFYIAFSKGNTVYGLLSIVATLLITFFLRGVTVTLILLGMVFSPYSLIAYFMKKFTYFKVKSGILRALAIVAFINLLLFIISLFIGKVALGYGDFNFSAAADKLGGYWVIALIVSVVALIFDFTFTLAIYKIDKVLKLREGKASGHVRSDDIKDVSLSPFSGYGDDAPNATGQLPPEGDQTQADKDAEMRKEGEENSGQNENSKK